ncbi:OmpH family outer membrane protein [Sphingopyxis sp. 113P3]|jgi:Outer membrane protein|uniref:OmpH family outer membrane protein n=1 Tax=Sphingopyxis sp. (strain 113P3) TaxID=292913 RepID=UPI0006AD36A7|nr:OmpH family outer membrane protein [Sphingopyxis sp. 113P3]ALC13056.1 outer membrane chaperone Skp [Sphingopyxis sp. 113P3]
MKKIFVASALAIAALSVSPMTAAPAAAQSKTGIGIADLDVATTRSNAYQTALNQIRTTYKAQIDQVEARDQTLGAELNVLRAKANEEAKKTPQNKAALDAAVKAFQDKSAAAQREIAQMAQPYELARAYAIDQITVRLDDAVKGAMTKRKVDLLLNYDQQVVLAAQPPVDITDAIIAELNTLVPSVSIAVPAGYQPGQLMQQKNQALLNAARAQQGQAAPAATTPAPATGTPPTTR